MATPSLTSRTLEAAAKRRIAASSVAPVASGYERSRELRSGERHCAARFSPFESTICVEGDR
jgi:hypothetical protein